MPAFPKASKEKVYRNKNMKHKGECTMNVNTNVSQASYEKLITEINEVTAENKSLRKKAKILLTAAFIVCDILFAVMIFTTLVR